jgi:hypothetical protein
MLRPLRHRHLTADPVGVIEAALVRLVDDVGVLAEEDVVRAFSILKATDLPSYLRLRHAAKKANRDCSVTVLDKLVRDELPGSDDDASALDELVALARAQCQLHHDADRNAVAVIPMPSRREVWRVYSSGFEEWLRAAYWRAKEMGVPETTMKSALATLAAAGINDGDEIEVHVRAARSDDGYLIDLADEQWQAIHVTPQGWQVVNESPVYFTRTPSMRANACADRGDPWRCRVALAAHQHPGTQPRDGAGVAAGLLPSRHPFPGAGAGWANKARPSPPRSPCCAAWSIPTR